jgi:hypothetical protein
VEREPIRALDTGDGGWFCVEVVLRTAATVDDDGSLAAHVAAELPSVLGPELARDPELAWSYDISPPEGGVGVGLWVRASSTGAAADAGEALVRRCADDLCIEKVTLWDLRVIPEEAVLGPRADWP